MKKEYDFSKMKKVGKGPVLDPKATKVQIGIRVDADVLSWLMAEAEKRGVGYQTYLGILLKEVMTKPSIEARLTALEKKILKDAS